MKKIFLSLIITFLSFNCFSQENVESDAFNSEKYQKLKEYYIESINSGKVQELQTIRDEFITKIGKDNFLKIKNSNSIDKWLKNNWESTSFSSLEEAEVSFTKLRLLDEKKEELIKNMTPLFSELRKEVGYSALFKKLSEDCNTNSLN